MDDTQSETHATGARQSARTCAAGHPGARLHRAIAGPAAWRTPWLFWGDGMDPDDARAMDTRSAAARQRALTRHPPITPTIRFE